MVDNHISTAGGAGMAGNVIFGGLIGIGVDASTGAMRDLAPNPIEVTLEEGEGTVVVQAKAELETNDSEADDSATVEDQAASPDEESNAEDSDE